MEQRMTQSVLCLGSFIWKQCRKWGGRRTCAGLETSLGACFDCPAMRYWRLVIGPWKWRRKNGYKDVRECCPRPKELWDFMTFNPFSLPEVCFVLFINLKKNLKYKSAQIINIKKGTNIQHNQYLLSFYNALFSHYFTAPNR